jgi:hypothetical protein
MPTSWRLLPLPWRTRIAPWSGSKVTLRQGERLVDPQTRAPHDHDQPAQPQTVRAIASVTQHQHHLFNARRISRIFASLVPRRLPSSMTGQRRSRPTTTSSIQQHDGLHEPPSVDDAPTLPRRTHCRERAACGSETVEKQNSATPRRKRAWQRREQSHSASGLRVIVVTAFVVSRSQSVAVAHPTTRHTDRPDDAPGGPSYTLQSRN